jgi:HD-GYP domain-containing protein (c-di-GMP phosphodiesterase class II)
VPVLEQGEAGDGARRRQQARALRLTRTSIACACLAESAWGLLRRKAHEQGSPPLSNFCAANVLATIDVINTIVEMRDPVHRRPRAQSVSHLARAIAAGLGLDEDAQERIGLAGWCMMSASWRSRRKSSPSRAA